MVNDSSKKASDDVNASKCEHAFIFLDFDLFDLANHVSVFIEYESVISQIKTVLEASLEEQDTLTHVMADKCIIISHDCTVSEARKRWKHILRGINSHLFKCQNHSFNIHASIGITPITCQSQSLAELIPQAALACSVAKENKKVSIHVYREDDFKISQKHQDVRWASQIKDSLNLDRFILFAQPIYATDNPSQKHYEILLRMQTDTGELIFPDTFIPVAERCHLMILIDRLVIIKVFTALNENPVFLNSIDFCSINLSGQSIEDEKMQAFVIKNLIKSKLPPGKICFEITESAAITNLSAATLFIRKLQVLGCRFALDDFGKGLSSFAYLKDLDVDYLKIDGKFVSNILNDKVDKKIIESIQDIADLMQISTVAECVETEEVKQLLEKIGINYLQGYVIAKPKPLDSYTKGK